MSTSTTVSRREFSVAAVLAALSGVAITVSSCGGGGSPTGGSGGTGASGGDGYGGDGGTSSGAKTGVVSSNHGHRAVIVAAQLSAAAEIALDIRGDSDHPHAVMLTAAEVGSIAASQRVSKESSSDAGHSHTVTFN
jgi:hypothetical protein